MVAFDYSRPVATALRLLQRYGGPVTLVRPSTLPPVYDPATGTSTPVAPAQYDGTGAVFDYKQSDIDGTKIKQGDQLLYLAVKQTNGETMPAPLTSDFVLVGTVRFAVQNPGVLAPAGVAVLYSPQLRGVA